MDRITNQLLGSPNLPASAATRLFAVIGLVWFATTVFSFVRLVASLFILPGTSLSRFGRKGTWAVITGASDGIGKEYALQLAAKGYNVCLVSRTKSKLDALATELQEKYKVETKILAMDYAANKDADYKALGDLVKGLEVSILVNNVGLSHEMPVPFAETSENEMKDIITINCVGTLRTTQTLLPAMIAQKHGLIITMGSFGGIIPTPFLATYSGSKAFLQQWSTALSSELAQHNIQVQLVQSYMVVSAMSKIRRSSWLVPTPRTFVRAALGKIGRSGSAQGIPATCTPYWGHALMHWAIATFVGTMSGLVLSINQSMMEATRKAALRKAARGAKKTS